MSTLVFISTAPLSRAPVEKAGLDWLVGKGISVQIWDLSGLYYSQEAISGYFAASLLHAYRNPLVPVVHVLSRQQLASLLRANRASKFLFFTFTHGDIYWILRLLRKSGISYFTGYLWPPYSFDNNPQKPHSSFLESIRFQFASAFVYLESLIRSCITNAPGPVLRTFLRRIRLGVKQVLFRFTSYYQRPDTVFTSGDEGVKYWRALSCARSVVSVDSSDLLDEEPSRIVQGEYIVFVDDAVCFSPDKKLRCDESANCLDYPGYLRRMEKLFDYLEDELSLLVVIGASYKYQYPSAKLCGRSLYYGQTRELIYHARYVLAHGSSATFQAAYCNKPICLISDVAFSGLKRSQVSGLASMFRASPVFSHDLEGVRSVLTGNSNAATYSEFVQKYLVSSDSKGSYLRALYSHLSRPE